MSILYSTVWTPTSIPIAHLEDADRYVCNPDNILSPNAVEEIDSLMRALEDSTGVETLIAVVDSISPYDTFQFAHELGEKYGVGSSERNDGLVILLCTSQRCIQFLTGYGIEGAMPDAICRRIQETHMNPYFANDDWDSGMVEGATAVKKILCKEVEYQPEDKTDTILAICVCSFLGFNAILVTTVVAIVLRRRRKCPKCGKHTLRKKDRTLIKKTSSMKKYSRVWECKECHHKLEREEIIYYGSSGSHSGGYRGGSHSGGHRGGHYGGGHFGGGGARSHF